jgi:hypothetical protein
VKRILYTIVLIFIFLVCNLFGPYNILQDLNADSIIKDVQLKSHFTVNPVQSADYFGNNTYLIITSEGTEYIARQEYFSMMNYKWKIYKEDRGELNE